MIFDRWGKLLLESSSAEYIDRDGIYEGRRMPSTDYWYSINMEELDYVRSFHSPMG